jgi:transmembrane sensor
VNQQIYREASEWLVDLRVGDFDPAASERLDAWFRASPEHIRAFLELSSIWEDGADPDLDKANSTDDLIARARTVVTNVVEIGNSSLYPDERPSKTVLSVPGPTPTPLVERVRARGPLRHLRFATAASIVFVSVAAGALLLYRLLDGTYSTGIGEQRTVSLSDGSRIELNALSRVRIRFSEGKRDVELLEGQVLFNVAKDPTRPFVVQSGATRVRAVGTEFDVYRKPFGTTVTVVEGRVAVLTAAEARPTTPSESASLPEGAPEPRVATILVSAGEQVTVTPSKVTAPARADIAAATAWTQRELMFDSTPLAEVAREFNRYNEKPLVVTDETLKNFHVTGIFSSTNHASLLKFLRAQEGIEVVETDSVIQITRK